MTISTHPGIAAGTYRIDPERSTVAFVVKALFGMETVRGTFRIRTGEIVVAADPGRSTARATIDAGSFTTDKPRRDRDVTSRRFLDAATYPTIAFTGTGLERGPDGWLLTGTLTVRETTCDVVVAVVERAATDTGCRLRGTATVDRHAAGVTAGRGMIARYLHITLDVVAVPATASSGKATSSSGNG
jgi:polyisoprenoid-binding protein YceI